MSVRDESAATLAAGTDAPREAVLVMVSIHCFCIQEMRTLFVAHYFSVVVSGWVGRAREQSASSQRQLPVPTQV